MSGPVGEYVLQGDAEAAILDIITNDTPELPWFPPHPTLYVSTNMRGYATGQRRIMITQEGSLERWPKIERPRIDVEVFAERRSVAHDIASICVASLRRAMGSYRGFGLFISDCKLEQGITRIPDKFEESSRYVFAVRLTIVPSAPGLTVPFS